jgi:predicted nucleic acid-binding protein
MSTLLDTNILTRLANTGDPLYRIAVDAVVELRRQGEVLCLVPQNYYEFWAVATRPTTQNGLGLTSAQAQAEAARVKGLFRVQAETPAVFAQWEQLVAQHQVLGKNAHDAHLVAAMMVHGVGRILTFNVADFRRFPNVTVLDPQQIVASISPTP